MSGVGETRGRLLTIGSCSVALSKRNFLRCIVAVIVTCWIQSAFALDPRYPDWPCQQLKVPGIAVASVWAGPSIDTGDQAKPIDTKQAELVSRLAARRSGSDSAATPRPSVRSSIAASRRQARWNTIRLTDRNFAQTVFAISRSLNFWTLPVLVFGSSANTMKRGHL